MQTVGEKIKAAREAARMTQEQLGRELGVTGVAVMRYEKGQRQPSINQRLLLADIFKTSLLYFIEQDIFVEEEIGAFPLPRDPVRDCLDSAFDLLNGNGQKKVADYAVDLSKIPEYQREQSTLAPQPPAEVKDTGPNQEAPETTGNKERG